MYAAFQLPLQQKSILQLLQNGDLNAVSWPFIYINSFIINFHPY